MSYKTYPGAKTNSGIIQFLVNDIPYHHRYFELCAGTAQLFKHKERARYNYLNDINQDVVNKLAHLYSNTSGHIHYTSMPLVDYFRYRTFEKNDFIYLDPPYPASARRSGASLYKHEMLNDDDHVQLLKAIQVLDANVMISTRPNKLYELHLKKWRKAEFETMGQRGRVTEVIYMNYDKPTILHQYDLLGADCWERQQLKRKRIAFANKMKHLPPHQAHMLIEQIVKDYPTEVQHFLTVAESKKILIMQGVI
jgi:site-specific DNA-adenine methylase